MSRAKTKLVKNINLIAIVIIGVLILGQDYYIFSVVGPKFDIGDPDEIAEVQKFGNMRNSVVNLITHGLLLAILFLLLMKPVNNIFLPTTLDKDVK